jgi:hypothetical protein
VAQRASARPWIGQLGGGDERSVFSREIGGANNRNRSRGGDRR